MISRNLKVICVISFEDFVNIQNASIHPDWNLIESVLGFQIHNGLKNFYSKMRCDKPGCIQGTYHLKASQFIQPSNNEFASWIELISGDIDYELYPLCTQEDDLSCIQEAFFKWTGGFNMGRRAMIGSFFTEVGNDFLLLFNNDTGAIEWNDPGFGYFEVYEQNPYGIFANDIEEFYIKLSSGIA